MAISTTPLGRFNSIIGGTQVGQIPALDASSLSTVTISPPDITTIKGMPIMATSEKSWSDLQDYPLDELAIKLELCDLLVKELFKTNMIEFTKEHDPIMGREKYRARIFVTPKDQTQLLRLNKVIT